jgi:hypothetical protein
MNYTLQKPYINNSLILPCRYQHIERCNYTCVVEYLIYQGYFLVADNYSHRNVGFL